MKRTNNIYKYLSFGLIAFGIAAIAFNPNKSQADSSSSSINESSITLENSSSTSRRRHQININVSSLEDIKVAEGDRVEVGSLISDKPDGIASLTALPNAPSYKPRSKD